MKKTVTKISLLLLFALSSGVAFAQTNLKAPVRFKLKNGLTIIVAQNTGSGKIYSRLTVENEVADEQKVVAQILETFLTNKASQFNLRQSAEGKITSQVTMSFNEANTSSSIFNFEQALGYVGQSFLNASLPDQAFAEMKSLYKGNPSDLETVTLAKLQEFYNQHFKASDIYITIAGDINTSDAKLITNRVFGEWKPEIAFASK